MGRDLHNEELTQSKLKNNFELEFMTKQFQEQILTSKKAKIKLLNSDKLVSCRHITFYIQ
jgi:hypothetical protein